MSSPEAPTLVTTTSRAIGATPPFLVYGSEACLLPETLMGSPRVQSLMSLCRNNYGVKARTPPTTADGERRSEMHGTTKRSGATTSGSCIVGSPGSGTLS
jgi:hypothetical protein